MGNSIKIRARMKGGNTAEVKSLIRHPMETGRRKNKKTGKLIPAHFIQEVVCTHNGKPVLNADWSTAISANPYLAFAFTGAKAGDKLTLSWKDNLGQGDSIETTIR